MNERARQEPSDGGRDVDEPEPAVRAHQSRPGRVVFTEDGNTEAWIATDLAVDPER